MGIETALTNDNKRVRIVKIVICFLIASVGGAAIGTAKTSLDAVHDHYTKGIEVQQVSHPTSYKTIMRTFEGDLAPI